MSRYFIHLAYQGTQYHGWQIQPNAITVQQVLNESFSKLLRQDINITGCGRTDTGVHARNFYAHFDITEPYNNELDKLCYKVNAILPPDIKVYSIREVATDLHARFSAKERVYKYYISNTKEIFLNAYCWQLYKSFDIDMMNKAAQLLINYTDFTSFSKLHTDVKTNNCTITHAEWKIENNLLVFTIGADRFLRNMVRSIVGTLIDIGLGKKGLTDFAEIIEKKDRKYAGTSVPAKGLFLEEILY